MIGTKVIESRWLVPRMATAITLFGLVFVRDRRVVTPRLLRHELIHCQQQLEWLYLPFFVAYLLEWLWHMARLRDWDAAYRAISFEREAYDNDHDPTYLQRRKLFGRVPQESPQGSPPGKPPSPPKGGAAKREI